MRISLLCIFAMFLSLTTRGQQSQYVPALPGYHYEFPRDHFDHPQYQTEWWYYTGNLRSSNGHRFGFELTFFREGTKHNAAPSPWSVQDVYMAHLALTDVSGGKYYARERLNRAGPGLAGVDSASQIVWNGNWKTDIRPDAEILQGRGDAFNFDLALRPGKPPVIHGQDGISQKAEGAGHASHYISFTRMPTTGTIELNGTHYSVEGDAWMDHEFFTDSVMGDEVGWDWLSIQFADETELMLYRLRHKDGSVDPYSSGTYVDRQGKPLHLGLRDFSMTTTGVTWKSEETGATYPLGWSVTVPELALQAHISTPLNRQEFISRFGPSYWEGAIDVKGSKAGAAIQGEGYLEMTGYSHRRTPLFPAGTR